MIQHSILGQAGSGKSTFIEQNFGNSKCVVFSVGSLLRKMLGQSGIADSQQKTNTWESADPLVYDTYKHLCILSDSLQVPIILDGFPRNGDQVVAGMNILKNLPASIREIQLHVHMLDIPEEEQIRRIEERQREPMDDYQIKRIKDSRKDFEEIIPKLAAEKEKETITDRISIQFNWWSSKNNEFKLINVS